MSDSIQNLVAGLVAGGIIVGLVLALIPSDISDEPEPTAHPTSTPVSPRTILSAIQNMDELITVRVDVALVELEVRDPAPLGCVYTAQHVAKGVVEAGIDLAAISESSIQKNLLGYPTRVTLPAPTLTSCRIEYFRQYDQQGGGNVKCFGDNWEAMSDIGRHLAMEQFVIHANQRSILERAGQQAVNVLGGFISSLTGGNVQTDIEERPADEEAVIPPSCNIDPPDNWERHEDGSGWRRK